jgi:hypothetical protein
MSHPATPNVSSQGSNGDTTVSEQDRRRSEPRILCDRDISILTLGAQHDRFVTAHLTDCSEHGLGFTLSEPVKAGQQLLVRMNVNKVMLMVYTLRYCIPTQTKQFRAGASFTGYTASSFQDEPQRIVSALVGDN